MSSTDPLDPRPTLRRAVLLYRLTPRWLRDSFDTLFSAIIRFHWRSKSNGLLRHKGIFLSVEGPNAELSEARLKAAIDVLAAGESTYLRWLHNALPVFEANPLTFRVPMIPNYRAGVATFNPISIWRVSAEELAVLLVAASTKGRLMRPFGLRRTWAARANRRALTEALSFARRLPGAHPLVLDWEGRLRAFDKAHPHVAA